MSVRLLSLVWQTDLPATEKMVLLALADAANDDGNCWPPISGEKGLCRKTSLSERAVQKAIKSLCEKLQLERIENPGKGVFYTLTPAPRAPPHDVRPAPRALTPAPRAPKPSVTVISSEAKASSDSWHRLPEGWVPSRPLPPKTQAKVDKWPEGALENELAALHRWAINAKNECGRGRKKDWDRAWVNWLERRHEEHHGRHSNGRTDTMGGNQSPGLGRTARAALRAFPDAARSNPGNS